MKKLAIVLTILCFFALVVTSAILVVSTLEQNRKEISSLKSSLVSQKAEDQAVIGNLISKTVELEKRILEVTGQNAEVVKSLKEIEKRPVVKSRSQEEIITAAVERVSPSVVSIIKKKSGREQGAGTGFVITKYGYILTNRHVVNDTKAEYFVQFSNGNKEEAFIIFQDAASDIAVLSIISGGSGVAKLGNSNALKLGQSVIAIGNALGEFNNSASVGVISGLNREIEAEDSGGSIKFGSVIQTDAAINRGNSGGPLINTDGEVIGVNVATAENYNNISFSIPINTVKKILLDSPLKLSL